MKKVRLIIDLELQVVQIPDVDPTGGEHIPAANSGQQSHSSSVKKSETTAVAVSSTAVAVTAKTPEVSSAKKWSPRSSCNECLQILAHLNARTGRDYKPLERTTAFIHSRHTEHDVDTCLRVIETKVEEWMPDDQMRKFLNPETLFRPLNFDKYRNQEGEALFQPDEKLRKIRSLLKEE